MTASHRNLVIVESPAKGRTIEKYLGAGYKVLASFGHVRDLPARDGSVRPDEDFAMDWELGDRAGKPLGEIRKAARDADAIYLATDPDREGEAISWHVQQVLAADARLSAEFHRITFNEITKSAVLDAVARPRAVNAELVEAYLARRALDYLVGFTLSPVLWRKLPGSRSAGRVQSVALRLICEREDEIEAFVPREYWTILVTFRTAEGATFTARLTHLDGVKLERFDLADAEAAAQAASRLVGAAFQVAEIETRQVRRNPAAPFTTSTLQQEASRKLGMSATQTMRTAQRLYEGVDLGGETVGLITYMRTDGTQLAGEAVDGLRGLIGGTYGDRYLPAQPRVYKSAAKNAQEAHEAIRPTDITRRPDALKGRLKGDELALYELIWRRTVACQMASAVLDQVAIDVETADGRQRLRATGSIVRFDGFLKVYEEGRDDVGAGAEGDADRRLPPVGKGDPLTAPDDPAQEQHFTQPPPRFTEASLVRRLEELGIGRPSTYASILQVLQDRDYVRLERKRFLPEDRGRLVTAFLKNFFSRYVEYDFTAALENQLDDISGGRVAWKDVLRDFWRAFSAAVEEARDLSITQVIDALDVEIGPHFLRDRGDGVDPRQCPSCHTGRLGLRLSRTGAFIGCSNYPDCRYTRPLAVDGGDEEAGAAFPRELGHDDAGLAVSVRKGPFGHYLQLGDGDGDTKPQRVTLPKRENPATVDLARALRLLALPREVGTDPNTNETVFAGIGRYGPYLRRGQLYKSLPADEDILETGLNRALTLLAEGAKRGGGSTPLRELGAHPKDGEPINLFKGRFGPYVRHGKVMASLPRDVGPDDIDLERAVALVDAKAARGKSGKSAKAGTTKRKTAGTKSTKAAAKPAKAAASSPAKATGRAKGAAAKNVTTDGRQG